MLLHGMEHFGQFWLASLFVSPPRPFARGRQKEETMKVLTLYKHTSPKPLVFYQLSFGHKSKIQQCAGCCEGK